jgi:hypothetical protein
MNVNFYKSIVAKIKFHAINCVDGVILNGGKLIGRFILPVILVFNLKKFVTAESYFPECKRKNKLQIFWEQFFYILRTGEINKHYFDSGLDRKSNKDVKNYIPWLTFTFRRNKLNQQPIKFVYDPYNYVCLLRDKFIFEAFCKRMGINTPTNIGLFNSKSIFLLKEKKFFDIDMISGFAMDAFCKKNVPYGGGMHSNILKLKIQNGIISLNNKVVTIQEFKKLIGNENWIIQERIKNQNPEFAVFHPQSINTVRIITVKKGNDINVIGSFLRMGVNGSYTDNSSSGGIACGIHLENGSLEKYGMFKPEFGTKCARHPNTGVIFEGYKIPKWREIVEYVKRAHSLFYGLHSIGWDVAVTDDGVMIVEGNDNWNTSGVQLYSGAKPIFDKYFR